MGSSSTSLVLGMVMACWAARASAISLPVTAPKSRLGGYLDHQALQLFGGGFGGGLLGGFLGLLGLLLLLHGVQVLCGGDHRQLPGQKEVPGVAVRDFHQLALLALAPHVLL